MYESYEKLKEFEGMDEKQRSQIIKISAMRLWEVNRNWKNQVFTIIFLLFLPALVFFNCKNTIESDEVRLLLVFVIFIVGYRIKLHFQIAAMLPYIQECIEYGVAEEDLIKLEKSKKVNHTKFSIFSGVFSSIIFAVSFQAFYGFSFPWLKILLISAFLGVILALGLNRLLKEKLEK